MGLDGGVGDGTGKIEWQGLLGEAAATVPDFTVFAAAAQATRRGREKQGRDLQYYPLGR